MTFRPPRPSPLPFAGPGSPYNTSTTGGDARDFVMAFVTVPDLTVTRSDQRYTPLGDGVVNYASGDFSADIHFDEDGLVRLYEDYLERVE